MIKEKKLFGAIESNGLLKDDENFWRSLLNNAILYEELGDYLNAKQSYDLSLLKFKGTTNEKNELFKRINDFNLRYKSLTTMQQYTIN